MFGRASFWLNSWLGRRLLARDPVWRRIDEDERKARKAHRQYAHLIAAKQERLHAALRASVR